MEFVDTHGLRAGASTQCKQITDNQTQLLTQSLTQRRTKITLPRASVFDEHQLIELQQGTG